LRFLDLARRVFGDESVTIVGPSSDGGWDGLGNEHPHDQSAEPSGGEPLSHAVVTADDIIECYHTILAREPETAEIVKSRVNNRIRPVDLVMEFVESPEFAAKRNAKYPLQIRKCYETPYLIQGLTPRERVALFVDNYDRLCGLIGTRGLLSLLGGFVSLYDVETDGHRYEIAIQISRDWINEGEISIWFRHASENIYVMAFTFVAADALKLGEGEAILVTRMQPIRGTAEISREAAKYFEGIRPKYALWMALQGIARASGIDRIVSPVCERTPSYNPSLHDNFVENYDDFLLALGGVRTDHGYYVMPVGEEGDAKRYKRVTRRRRRAAKEALRGAVEARWTELMGQYLIPPEEDWETALAGRRRPDLDAKHQAELRARGRVA
jgi:uncharacterized protein VirK/YbjX